MICKFRTEKCFFQHAVLSKFLGLTLLITVSVLTVKNGVVVHVLYEHEVHFSVLFFSTFLVFAKAIVDSLSKALVFVSL